MRIFLTLSFFLIIYTANCQVKRQHLIFQSDFTDQSSIAKWNKEIPSKKSITITDSVLHNGKPVLQVVLNKSDILVAGSVRAELALRPDSVVKVERWVGISMFLPASFISDPEPESVLQWHDIPDKGGPWRTPSLGLWVRNGKWILLTGWSSEKLTSNETSHHKLIDLGNYQTSVWTNWVFHIRFSWESDGFIELWENGKLVQKIDGPNAYNDVVGNYLKVGIYKWMWAPAEKNISKSIIAQRIIYYSDLRVGDEKATYKDVVP